MVFKEIVLFWEKARIPVRDEHHCILKLEKLHQNLRELQKSAKRVSEKNTKNVNEFKEKLNDLFDVSHSNALNMMKIEEDKKNLAKKENRVFVNLHKIEQRRKRSKIEIEQFNFNTDGSSTEDEVDIEEEDITPSSPSPSCCKKQRGSKEFITLKLLAALDKCKLSDRDAVHIIISTADALEKESLILHWDGKLLPDITHGKLKVDRLPVIVSFEGITQLLGVPKLKSGTVETNKSQIRDFCLQNLKKQQCRDDYKELLELTVIFLGENPPNGIFFHYPGAFHHARRMSKAIYSFKIYMFRKQFKLNIREENALRDIYKAISNTATHKFCGHLWYLAPESIAMSFFDFRVPTEIKIKMIEALKSTQNNDNTINKIVLSKEDIKTFIKKELHEFVSPEPVNFFSRFKISTDLIDFHPDSWKYREDYEKGINILIELSVVNDVAERGVKLIQEYNTEPLPGEGNISKEALQKIKDDFINSLRLDRNGRLDIENK
ncbi:hypothetical protein AGLY_018045, partial [Aphis glycines]